MSLYRLARPFLFNLDAEKAHGLALKALAVGAVPHAPTPDPRLRQHVMGLDFPSPVGLAAGFDKNAEAPDGALDAGFGFAEVGTVTPHPQAGNPRPRVFRLPADHGVINRLGFNNEGFEAAHRRLVARRGTGIVGVNVGANKDSADRVADYAAGVARFADLADYITVNVSSPNTPGLRELQSGENLDALLNAVAAARDAAPRRVPLLIKISPDIDAEADLGAIVEGAVAHGLDGMIVSNTTLARDGLTDRNAGETGGLSGRPLFPRSTALIARVRSLAGEALTLIGVGGIESADTAWDKMAAGADLVQLYTGMVYEGPDIAAKIAEGLARRLDREKVGRIADIVGTDMEKWLDGAS